MLRKIDISAYDYTQTMSRLVTEYDNLILDAKKCRRNHLGKMTVAEAEFYDQAVKVCKQIIDLNPTGQSVQTKWLKRKKECQLIIDEIADTLAPPQPIEESKAAAPIRKVQPQNAPAGSTSGFVTKNACDEVKAEDIQKWHKEKPWQNFEAMSGMADLKQRLMDEVATMGWNRVDDRLKIKPAQRYFFYGPPGTGKSTIIRAFAHEMMERDENFHFIQLKGGDIHAGYVGVAEKIVQIAFQEAVDHEPCLIFIDEVEEVCLDRGAPNAEGHANRLTVAFLQAIDTLIDTRKRVIFMGATNYPDRVDAAMMNRVKLIKVPLPDEAARVGFFTRQFDNLKLEEGFTVEDMADVTDNCSYRDLENIAEGIALKIRKDLIEQYKIYDENGNFDQDASDLAADKALAEGCILLTRAMFEESMAANPPSDKTEIRERLRAFEERVKVLQKS